MRADEVYCGQMYADVCLWKLVWSIATGFSDRKQMTNLSLPIGSDWRKQDDEDDEKTDRRTAADDLRLIERS